MESVILTPEQWPLVESIVTDIIGDPMPIPQQSTFSALMDGERLAGFVWVEYLYHFKNVYVVPEYQHLGLAKRLLQEAVARIPRGHAAICLPDPKQEHLHVLARNLGARKLMSRVVLRKDVF